MTLFQWLDHFAFHHAIGILWFLSILGWGAFVGVVVISIHIWQKRPQELEPGDMYQEEDEWGNV